MKTLEQLKKVFREAFSLTLRSLDGWMALMKGETFAIRKNIDVQRCSKSNIRNIAGCEYFTEMMVMEKRRKMAKANSPFSFVKFAISIFRQFLILEFYI